MIAQEVDQVFPELVHVDHRGYKTVNYMGFIAPLIEAVTELGARITALENAREAHGQAELPPPELALWLGRLTADR